MINIIIFYDIYLKYYIPYVSSIQSHSTLLSHVSDKTWKVIICGGGRKNNFLIEKIKKNTLIKKVKLIQNIKQNIEINILSNVIL